MLSRDKLRILYLSPNADLAGAETSLLDVFSDLDRKSFEPLVVMPVPGPLLDRVTELGIEGRVIPLQQLKAKNPWPYLRSVWRLLRLLMTEKVDLIHANMDICNQYAIVPAKLLGIPIICHIRNIPSQRGFRRMFLSFSNVLIANSEASLRSVSRFWPRSQRRLVVYNSINPRRLRSTHPTPRSRWGIPEDAYVILQMARLSPFKGQHILLESLFELMPKHPHLYAIIAGDTKIDRSDAYRADLEAQVRKHGLEKRILFTGFVKEVGDLLAASDALVLVSEEEGFGRVLVEAMLYKKPVIAARAAGPNEIIRDGQTGILVASRNSTELATALVRLLENPDEAATLAENGYAWATTFFSPSNTIKALEAVYLETAAGGRAH